MDSPVLIIISYVSTFLVGKWVGIYEARKIVMMLVNKRNEKNKEKR